MTRFSTGSSIDVCVEIGDVSVIPQPIVTCSIFSRERTCFITSIGQLDQLTTRERDVLQYIARGNLYEEAALELGISVKTVEAHVSAVLRKLQLSNRHQLSRWAIERRLVE